jgi:hypothetical protein
MSVSVEGGQQGGGAASAQNARSSKLAEFVYTTLFSRWATNRAAVLEAKWNRNRNAANSTDADEKPGSSREKAEEWQSAVYYNHTSQKIETVYALGTDMLFRGGEVAFCLKDAAKGPVDRAVPQDQTTAQDQAREQAEALIRRQLQASRGAEQLSLAFKSMLEYGECWAKTYEHDIPLPRWVPRARGSNALVRRVELKAARAVEYRSPWVMYWDLESGDPAQGEGIVERKWVSADYVRDLLDEPDDGFYDRTALKAVLSGATASAGGATSADVPRLRDLSMRTRGIELLEFWGRVPRDYVKAYLAAKRRLAAAGHEESEPVGTEPELARSKVEVFLQMADGHIIALVVREPGASRPFHRAVAEDALDEVAPRGVADNVAPFQTVLNTLLRGIVDNLSAVNKLILACRRRAFVTQPEQALSNGKATAILELQDEDTGESLDSVFRQVKIDPLLQELRPAFEFMHQLADLGGNIPRAEQGAESTVAMTAYELQARLDRSGKYIARLLRNFDQLVEKIVDEMFAFNQEDEATPLSSKGDFRVVAQGFAAFENRIVRLQKLLQLLNLISASPDLLNMTNLRWLLTEIAKAMDLESDMLLKSEEQLQQEAAAREQSAAAALERLQVATGEASVELLRARTAREQAGAGKLLKDAQLGEERLKMDRARTIADLSGRARAMAQTDIATPGMIGGA